MDSFNQYLKSIQEYKRITTDREKELSSIIQTGIDEVVVEKAKKELIVANLLLVISRATKFYHKSPKSITLLDLISEGNMGLMRAAEGYNAEKNPEASFCVYAVAVIDNYLYRAIWMSSFIRVPESHAVYVGKLRDLMEEYKKNGNELTDEIIIQRLEISVELLKRLKGGMLAKAVTSLEDFENVAGESVWADVMKDSSAADPSDKITAETQLSCLGDYLKRLSLQQRKAVELRHLHPYPLTYEEMSKKLGITAEGARQIYLVAMRKLRYYMMKS